MPTVYKRGYKYTTVIGSRMETRALPKPVKIFCKIFYCKLVGDAACCCVCPRFLACDLACLNSFDKCGMSFEDD